MLMKHSPYIASVEVSVQPDQKQIYRVRDMNQIHFAILDHKDHYHTLEETLPYIDIKVIHTEFTYPDGKEKRNETVLGVKDCVESDFNQNDDQRKYYEASIVEEKQNLICLSEEALDLTIEGNI